MVAGVEGMVVRDFRHGAGATIADAMASGAAVGIKVGEGLVLISSATPLDAV